MSDIHGFGNVYYAMMNYLDNINKDEEIELYINGDLIDRGYESAEILLDIKKRIEENKYKIVYLGGNHELMMHELFLDRKQGKYTYFNNWYNNGGYITDDGLYDILKTKEKILEVVDFVSNLEIYHKFEEKINNKPIILVHAACPVNVKDNCPICIKDDNSEIYNCVWARKHNYFGLFKSKIGNEKYFTIIGHTPNNNALGYYYDAEDNTLNIDGGCASHVSGCFAYNHFPLVEVCDNYLKILTFNSNNEITHGNYFYDNKVIPYSKNELKIDQKYLNKDLKVKKLALNSDHIVYYKN